MGIATQKEHLRKRLVIHSSATQLSNFLHASVELMKVMARACGHEHLSQFAPTDLTTHVRSMSDLTGVRFAGVGDC